MRWALVWVRQPLGPEEPAALTDHVRVGPIPTGGFSPSFWFQLLPILPWNLTSPAVGPFLPLILLYPRGSVSAPWRRGSWNTWTGTRCGQKQGPAPALSPGDPQDRQAPAELCRAAWSVIGSSRGPGPCGYEKPQPQPLERRVVPPRLRPWHVGTRVQKHTFNEA